MKIYRQGAIGALLDIYETEIYDFQNIVKDIPDRFLTVITDPDTTDENCKSIQAILTHVVHAGNGYAISIQNTKGYDTKRPPKTYFTTTTEYLEELNKLVPFTESILKEFTDAELRQNDGSLKMLTGWGQCYDIEQLFEHAIVHILRHKRQIEKIKLKEFQLQSTNTGP